MALLYIARKLYQAVEGKELNVPFECKKIDCLGNHNGHVDFEDVKIIGEKAIDEVGDIASGVSDFVENVGEHVGDAIEHVLNWLF